MLPLMLGDNYPAAENVADIFINYANYERVEILMDGSGIGPRQASLCCRE